MDEAQLSISVIIPTFNRANVIAEAIDSVLAQSHPANEIIVVDDGSSDATEAVLKRYGSRIHAIKQENQGVSAARNTGVAAARSEWIAFLDSDDIWHSSRLQVFVRDMKTAPVQASAHLANVELTGPGYHQNLFELRGLEFPECQGALIAEPLYLCMKDATYLQSLAIRRTTFEQLGGFDAALRHQEDTKLIANLALATPFVVNGQTVAQVRRLEGDTVAIGITEPLGGLDKTADRVAFLRDLYAVAKTRGDKQVAGKSLSHSLVQLAKLTRGTGNGPYLRLLYDSVRCHPTQTKAFIKAVAFLVLGTLGLRLTSRRPTQFGR